LKSSTELPFKPLKLLEGKIIAFRAILGKSKLTLVR